jgi:peptidoglycan/xylan/chitin deacetylase (PgdA/CDA1 family)
MEKKQIIITTSWDDGHALDARLAELLDKYNMKGTFYTPIRNPERPVMSASILHDIAQKQEIGGHTVNHVYLNTLGKSDAKYEIFECKTILEQQLGREIEAFCYPGGKFSQRDTKLVKEAGYLFGRTTRFLHTTSDVSSQLLDTSVQVYNHSSTILTAHCLKNIFIVPILRHSFFYKGNRNFLKLAEILLERIIADGGVFHLWGHSWEIEEFGLWRPFEQLLSKLAYHDEFLYLNNTECWKALSPDADENVYINQNKIIIT